MPEEHRRILVVEDDASHARIVERAFERSDEWAVAIASSVSEAKQRLSEQHFDVIVADLVLPDGKGVELIHHDVVEAPPVVVMTSHGDEKIAVEAMRAGAFDYVVKSAPTLLELPHVAKRTHREWKLRNEKAETERALTESEARIRAIINAVPDLIFVHSANGTILQCEGNLSVIPCNPALVLGMPLADLVSAEDLELVQQMFNDVKTMGRPQTVIFRSKLANAPFFEMRLTRYGTDQFLGLVRDVTAQQEAIQELSQLSRRENDVLKLVMEGLPNKNIALQLGISIKTVETHRSNLMKKLKVKSVAELARLALSAENIGTDN